MQPFVTVCKGELEIVAEVVAGGKLRGRVFFLRRRRGRACRRGSGRCYGADHGAVVCFVQGERQRLIAFRRDYTDRGIAVEAFTNIQSAVTATHIILGVVTDKVRIGDLLPRRAANLHIGDRVEPIFRVGKRHVEVVAEVCRYRVIGRRIRILYRRRLLGRLRWGSGRRGRRDRCLVSGAFGRDVQRNGVIAVCLDDNRRRETAGRIQQLQCLLVSVCAGHRADVPEVALCAPADRSLGIRDAVCRNIGDGIEPSLCGILKADVQCAVKPTVRAVLHFCGRCRFRHDADGCHGQKKHDRQKQ